MSEARLWVWLGGVLPPGQYSRIESGDTSPGFPDVHYQLDHDITGTMELKKARRQFDVVPFTSKHGMRKSQIFWIRDNIRCGGVVWIIAEVTPYVYIIPGRFAGEINGSTHSKIKGMARYTMKKNETEEAARILNKCLIGETR